MLLLGAPVEVFLRDIILRVVCPSLGPARRKQAFDVLLQGEDGDICSVQLLLLVGVCWKTTPFAYALRRGFLAALFLVLRLAPRGVMVAGPPCGSFAFLSRATSGRSRARPFGFHRLSEYVWISNTKLGTFTCTWSIEKGRSVVW